MILGQHVMAGQVGHYVPREKGTSSAEAYVSSLRVNQQTGMIDPAWMIKASQQATETSRDELYWISMGPDNMGGRATSIVYNNANMNEVFVGSMGGGVFYTWNLGVSWHQVGENLMVSCLAQGADGTIYVGTGEGGDAVNHNNLVDMSYDNSFIGSGLYTIKKVGNEYKMNAVSSTTPTVLNDVTEWCFINDVAVSGNTVIVATETGLRYSNDNLATWKYAKTQDESNQPVDLTGIAAEVKVASDNTILASVDGRLYIGSLDNMVCRSNDGSDLIDSTGMVKIATAAGLLDIAVAPSDPKVIYAATIAATGNHAKVYASEDQGQTWRVVLPTVTNTYGHQVYDTRGLYNHGLTVNPANPDELYVCGHDLWFLKRAAGDPDGYYLALKQSDGDNTTIYSTGYLHSGVNAMEFDPRDPSKAYIATDGGIYKSLASSGSSYLSYTNCNRGYTTTRVLGVAPSGLATRITAGVLDHGPVLIEADEEYGNIHMSHGYPLLPSNEVSSYGAFDESYNAGNTAVSVIYPNAFFLTTKDGGMKRTETAGADYDISNFSTSFTYTGYNLPIVLWENFNDQNSTAMVWYYSKDTITTPAGQKVQCYSNNHEYPFTHVLEDDLAAGDSVLVHDPIISKLFVASNNTLSVTFQGLRFDTIPVWYTIAKSAAGFSGNPSCMSIEADGDVLFVGMRNGNLYRVTNLRAMVDANTADLESENFAPVVTQITLPVSGQCITSVSIYANDANKVVVTLGNYGNDQYVLSSNNALSNNPTFTVKQGNLPKMPVYSSLYEMTTGKVLLGTERGIFMTDDINASNVNWMKANSLMGEVPVMDLKQQTVYHPDQVVYTTIINPEGNTIQTTVYPGVHNQGAIYAATYGRGIFRCENYLQHVGEEVVENTVAATTVNMYPNPVRDNAKISFELNNSNAVSYQVFDMMGRVVRVMNLGTLSEGVHEVNVSVDGLASGAYMLRLNAGTNTSTVKFMVY